VFNQLRNLKILDARITFEEFVPIFKSVCKDRGNYTPEQLVEGLLHFDREGNGTIAIAELRHLLTALGFFYLLEIRETNINNDCISL
jgi:Ca2+-binding EF-hand superfamily protein